MLRNSLYIHIPFCRSKCPYCGFYSILYNRKLASSYLDIILKQLNSFDEKFRTLYIGGGTPTVPDALFLKKLINALGRHREESSEFTIEANPESLTEDKLSIFLDGGINRLSVGVQSFNDNKLKSLGRIHNSKKAKKSLSLAAKKGFKNIGIDLIFGVSGEDMSCWEKDLEGAVRAPATHISCYSLTYERATAFLKSADRIGTTLPDEETADMYIKAVSYLSDKGFKQYEISNFSKEAFQSRHNLTYWNNDPYTGLGPSAVSYIDGSREENICDITEYIKRIGQGVSVAASREKLSSENRAKETAALKIRTMEGLDFEHFRKKTGFDFVDLEKDQLPRLIEDGLIEYKKDKDALKGVRLTRKGLLFCDIVSSAFI